MDRSINSEVNTTGFFKRTGSAVLRGWMAFARALAVINTTLILTLVYVLIMGPSWLIMKIARKDLLDRSIDFGGQESWWKVKEPLSDTMERIRRQF